MDMDICSPAVDGEGAGPLESSSTTTREWQAASTIAVGPLASHTPDREGTAEGDLWDSREKCKYAMSLRDLV